MFEVGATSYSAADNSTNFTFSRGGFQGSRGENEGEDSYVACGLILRGSLSLSACVYVCARVRVCVCVCGGACVRFAGPYLTFAWSTIACWCVEVVLCCGYLF